MGCFSSHFKQGGRRLWSSDGALGSWWSREAHLSCTAQGAGPRGATGSTQSAETQETPEAFVGFPLYSLFLPHPKTSSSEVNGKHPASTKFFLPVLDEENPQGCHFKQSVWIYIFIPYYYYLCLYRRQIM